MSRPTHYMSAIEQYRIIYGHIFTFFLCCRPRSLDDKGGIHLSMIVAFGASFQELIRLQTKVQQTSQPRQRATFLCGRLGIQLISARLAVARWSIPPPPLHSRHQYFFPTWPRALVTTASQQGISFLRHINTKPTSLCPFNHCPTFTDGPPLRRRGPQITVTIPTEGLSDDGAFNVAARAWNALCKAKNENHSFTFEKGPSPRPSGNDRDVVRRAVEEGLKNPDASVDFDSSTVPEEWQGHTLRTVDHSRRRCFDIMRSAKASPKS